MVVLSRISTKTGDLGMTHLGDMSRVAKTDPRIGAVGAVAETSAAIGLARAAGLPERLDAWAGTLQQELFDLGADLATPLPGGPDQDQGKAQNRRRARVRRIGPAEIARLEAQIGDLASELGPLRSFILPGGPPGAAHLHLAVTVARRAEREAWSAAAADGIGQKGGLAQNALVYLNRLSDLLFQMARAAGGPAELWQPDQAHSGVSEREGPASIQDNSPAEAPRESTSK
ncbi:MAG: cob(I)yrinic acid a,c-diamide adenosyltransferase [Bifidobacteriaceae bacterium]|jgi:cob(I)alamin adenosyltransferase|nr:cob(I)yrinic acid a,c-diamide adenosyltransferase [Bifidobacteriaceae bacterium]